MCYTPYGEAIVDEHLTTYENPFKFSGKELDDITGLYDHGARSRNPISTLWYGVDPLWEKYPGMSPYNYCAGNPVKLVDPDGRGVYFNRDGEYLGTDDDGYKGNIYITTKEQYNNPLMRSFTSKPLSECELTAKAYSRIYTNVLTSNGIPASTLHNGQVSVNGMPFILSFNKGEISFQWDLQNDYNDVAPNVRFTKTEKETTKETGLLISVNQISSYVRKELTTVENIYNCLGVHEYLGHGINRFFKGVHNKAYELQILDPSFDLCTEQYKRHVIDNYFKKFVNPHSIEHENVPNNTEGYRKAFRYHEIYKKWR